MKAVYLSTDREQFLIGFKKVIQEFYEQEIDFDLSNLPNRFIFSIPFSEKFYARLIFKNTTVRIDNRLNIESNNDFLFYKDNTSTTFNLLILKNNSITLLQGDSNITYGGQSIYSILNTDKGLVFFSCCERPDNIDTSKIIHIESGKDLTPITFGNQVLSYDNEVLKQPFRLTDEDGEIYTALDIYNISYKPEGFIALPKSFISSWNLASKDNPQEPIMTSLLIYDEEEEG